MAADFIRPLASTMTARRITLRTAPGFLRSWFALPVLVTFVSACNAYDESLLHRGALQNPQRDGSAADMRDAGMDAARTPYRDAGSYALDAELSQADSAWDELDADTASPDAMSHDERAICDDNDCCPDDDAKSSPGTCGCGVPDSDSDGDGTADCIDGCGKDSAKTVPGICGCGMTDSDSDRDGTADCIDGCPSDAAKTAPGICGCNLADDDSGEVASCAALLASLVHRYRFDGNGAVAIDSVSRADGELIGDAQLTGSSTVVLDGTDDYVDLPNGIISALGNATFEVWLTWAGGAEWQRIFDFGDPSTDGEGAQNVGRTYLFLTPSSSSGFLRVSYSLDGMDGEVSVEAAAALESGALHHVAVVVDDDNDLLLLYRDGALEGSTALQSKLSEITDINNWLGRSQYQNDQELAATLAEFRIYRAALTAAQVETSFKAGPDPTFLER